MYIKRRKFVSAEAFGVAAVALPNSHCWAILQASGAAAGPAKTALAGPGTSAPDFILPQFHPVQSDLFSASGAQTNCWVDVEVTSMTKTERTKTRFAEIDGNELPRRVLTVRVA